MTKNTKIILVGCLVVVIIGICCLAAGLVIGYFTLDSFSLDDFSLNDQGAQNDRESDFPDSSPGGDRPDYSPPSVANGEYQESDCPFRVSPERISCGYLGVPEDHSNPNSRTITLAVATVHSQGSSTGNPPLVYLEGGPGGSALDGAVALWLNSPLIQEHDVILLDQRGTGYSLPTLNCVEYDDPDYYEMDDLEIIETCRNRLENEGIDLNLYNSAQSAADVEALRLAFGYEEIDLLGISYGTRLALTVMRDHPGGVRSVILDSVYPPHIDALNEEPKITIEALLTLTNGCQADPACSQAYPNLETVLFDLIEELEYNPEMIEFWDADEEEYYSELYFGYDLIYTLVDYLYDTPSIPYLPAFIYALHEAQYDEAFEILDIPAAEFEANYEDVVYGEDVSDSEGMYYSVECYEEVGFNRVGVARSLALGYDETTSEMLVWGVEDMIDACDLWGSQSAPAIENQPVVSEIPTLVLNGEYDPVTPPSWAESTASYLNNSQLFIFPGFGHAVIDAGSCPVTIMLEFLSEPGAPLSAACFSQVGPPDFAINP